MSISGRELVAAARREDGLARVRQLLDLGLYIDFRDNGSTALMMASLYGRAKTVDLLLERGAKVNAVGGGDTALTLACFDGHLDILKKLVAAGASLTVRGQAPGGPLLMASFYRHLECCVYLLSLGADLMADDGDGRTPLTHFGSRVFSRRLFLAVAEHARTVMTAAWRAGPHPSQVQRRMDEAWDRRKSLMQVSAENGYRPLLYRLLAEKAAIASLDPAAPIPAIEIDTPAKRHAHLLGQVLANKGIHRLIVSIL